MLLTMLVVGYATTAGAMLAYLMQPYVMIQSARAKIGWTTFAVAGGMLWPLTIVLLWIVTRVGCAERSER